MQNHCSPLVRIVACVAVALAILFGDLANGAKANDSSQPNDVPAFVPDSFTLVVLPDTQNYTDRDGRYLEHFESQTKWIAANVGRLQIKYVLHLGDIVQHNRDEQWKRARAAIGRLDGKVPYALVAGNHDCGPNGNGATRESLLSKYFPPEDHRDWPTFGGTKDAGRLDNSFHTFQVNGNHFLILALEWGPRDETLAWADQILTRHPDHRTILITHAYMYYDDTRYDWATRANKQHWNPHSYGIENQPGGVNDGQQLWEKLVRRHAGMMMTLSGHVLEDGLGRLSSRGERGNVVHEMLVNYQMHTEGGTGWLRLMEFRPDGKTVQVKAYSPSLDKYRTDPQNQFRLEMVPALKPVAASD